MNFWRPWVEPLLDWRDRLLSDPDFQARSLRWPFARWVARRRMRALFDLCGGFVYSQVLLACTRLDLFEALSQSPRSVSELAQALDLPAASTARLLEAAQSLRLVEARGRERFGLGPLGAALRGNSAVAMMIEHHAAFYADLSDPVALLRGERESTELARFWAYSGHEHPDRLRPEDTGAYSELMAASQGLIAEQVLSAYRLDGHRQLLDVGGGSGAFVSAALSKHAALKACVFDLPPVVSAALERFRRCGVQARASVSGGSFLSDPLPGEPDLVSLIRILHDHDDEDALRLLRAVRRAIKPDGVLLIAEPMLGTPGAESVSAAYFGFYLMAMGQGRPRSFDTIRAMLHEAGFDHAREHRTSAPLLVRVLTSRPSKADLV